MHVMVQQQIPIMGAQYVLVLAQNASRSLPLPERRLRLRRAERHCFCGLRYTCEVREETGVSYCLCPVRVLPHHWIEGYFLC